MKIFKSILCAVIVLITYSTSAQYLNKSLDLNQSGALKLAAQAGLEAQKLNKNVSIAILNSSGTTLLLLKGDQVGPHNTEASRKKAYTSLSTKTPSFELMRKAAESRDAKNLNTVDELLLLGGGAPIWKDGELVGGIGISGGGSGENDHKIALAALKKLGFAIN
ncbi:GlcG/HbpS family heme-binding protein [Salegentibacter salegens]|uniref:Uncharacterized conserved protein GlcG, DUF336 family n=1 Tax=Salegentibacter salegens TaxID=143223 RepID=A0A1M7NNF4_9FLAO|nr:uncharacterized protein GlcG (DUF336 family) [Salegentibacter salegens]SHN05525.1 Uncharacterized conserved protein GlcG, DUF336 family [Salegentibacter salegens]